MSKTAVQAIFAFILLCRVAFVHSAEICSQQTSFIFFNGVQTTLLDARTSTIRLSQRFPAATPSGEHIEYRLAYNFSSGFEDFVETFDQRFIEQQVVLANRFELFFDTIHGNDSDLLGRIESAFPEFIGLITDLRSLVTTAEAPGLADLLAHPPTSINYINQKNQIDTLVSQGEKLIFFAHSQGNLFANAAYEYVVPQVTADAVKLVHVAPASPTTHGQHTLANLDLVIFALRAIGTVPSVTDDIPIPPRPADEWGETDWKGHGLWPIYMNTELAPFARIRANVTEAINTVRNAPVLACIPPTTVNLSNKPTPLLNLFAGEIAHDDGCRPNPGQIHITDDGAVVGTGCFEAYSFPASTSYQFDQAGSSLYFSTYTAFLDIHQGLGGTNQVDLAVANTPGIPNAITGGGPSTIVRSITIDKVARLKQFLAFINGKPCTASYIDPSVSLDTVTIQSSRLQVVGDDLIIASPAGTIASASLQAILGNDFLYEETHFDEMTSFPNGMNIVTQHFDPAGGEHSLRVYIGNSNDFVISSRSEFRFPSSRFLSLGCVAS